MKEKLEESLTHIEKLTKLTEGNVYQDFIYSKLISMKLEIERQLKLVKNGKPVV